MSTPLLDVCGLKDRVNALQIDSMIDPLDRFNFNITHTELNKDIDNDWNVEIYLMNLRESVEEALANRDDDIGFLKINKHHASRSASISFYLRRNRRGQGHLSTAKQFIGNRVFGDLGFNRIYASCMESNAEAMVIYGKYLKAEGVRREDEYYRGKYWDRHLFGILKSESAWA